MEESIKKVTYHGYIVTSEGRAFNSRGRELKPYQFRTGYWYFTFYIKGFGIQKKSIHRLLATLFIPNPENKPVVNHKDGNKSNWSLDNLEWMTKSENELHARYTLKVKRASPPSAGIGEDNSQSHPVCKIDPLRHIKICTYVNVSLAGWDMGINESNIRQSIKNGGFCSGFKWEYERESKAHQKKVQKELIRMTK